LLPDEFWEAGMKSLSRQADQDLKLEGREKGNESNGQLAFLNARCTQMSRRGRQRYDKAEFIAV